MLNFSVRQQTKETMGEVEIISPQLQQRFEEILKSLNMEADSKNAELLRKAFHFATEAHTGQTRLSGDPYIVHPLEIMGILAELNVDMVTLMGAMLHDVVEDTGVTIEDVANEFGPVVAILVDGMTKLSYLRYDTRSNEERQAEYFRKMLLSMAQDLRVILIKLADRLHNLRTIDAMPENSRKRIAQETLDIYAPLAHRCGIGRLKMELEDLSLKVLDEVTYRRIAERVAMKREEREEAIQKIINILQVKLKEEGIEAEIQGRAKHFYSIYNKIKRRGKSFEEILDLLAIRVVVKSIPDCYRTLGIVHSVFTPIAERFSDHIAMPKGNMYQSLHTKVIDKSGRTVEVQIRTFEMDYIAEVGIAAHWQYKEGHAAKSSQKDNLQEYYRWLRQVIEGSKEENSSEEFMETLKINLFTDEIIIFTPRGKLIQLPKLSTPIDFAFAVHTDIGLHVLGAKVNGRMVSLDHTLNTGDTVEILTSANARPSLDWLRFVHTSRARSKIKRYFKEIRFEESIRLGEELLSKELHRHRHKFVRSEIAEILNDLGQPTIEALLGAIGSGDISVQSVVHRLIGTTQLEEEKTSILAPVSGIEPGAYAGIKVQGKSNILTSIARCCNPLPGDPIIGFTSKGRGIIIHRNDCHNIVDMAQSQDKIVKVEWDASRDDHFQARLRIYAENRRNLLRDITEAFSKWDINIIEANLRSEGLLAVGILVLEVKGRSQLTKLMNRALKVKSVLRIERVNVAESTGES